MGNWFPRIYDIAMLPLERTRFKRIRKELIAKATGRVLEIGAGTGLNFAYYYQAKRVDAIDPNPFMEQQSLVRKRTALVPIQTHIAEAEELPFSDNTFDTVVATLVFCTIPYPGQAMKEIKRVSKPGARILFFEHVRMDQKLLGRAQDVLTPAWKKVCDGCHLNRDTLAIIKQANLSIEQVDDYFKGLFLTVEAVNNKAVVNDPTLSSCRND